MAEYILREQAIRAVTGAKLPDVSASGLPIANGKRSVTDCVRRLKDIPAADVVMKREIERMVVSGNMPRWIPVTERLPGEFGRYLCRYRVEDRETIGYCTDFGRYDPEHGEWFVGTVTHWMPLPPAPKDGE